MAIHIIPMQRDEEKDIHIDEYDANLIRDIKHKIGMVQAIRVCRWLTKGSLKSCKEFVESFDQGGD